MRFPKAKRLTLPVEFGRVKSEGTARRGRFLVLGVFPKKDEAGFRVGFVTSKRVGTAVVRNRIRRRLREIVRTEQQGILPGFWFVVVARSSAKRATYAELKDEWLRLAASANLSGVSE